MHDMLEAMLDAVELSALPYAPPSQNLNEDEWDKRGE
jgi:hypothetical protein